MTVDGCADCTYDRRYRALVLVPGRALTQQPGQLGDVRFFDPAPVWARQTGRIGQSAIVISDEVIDGGDGGEAAEDVVAHHGYRQPGVDVGVRGGAIRAGHAEG